MAAGAAGWPGNVTRVYQNHTKGTNQRWRDVLSDPELALYEAAMARGLPPDCATWLEQGGPVA